MSDSLDDVDERDTLYRRFRWFVFLRYYRIKNFCRDWKTALACHRAFADLRKTDLASLKIDLQEAISLIENAELRESDGNYCSRDNFAHEAIHLVKSAIGQRVRPPMYSQGMFTTWQHVFGYRAPSCKEYAGRRPSMRLYKPKKEATDEQQ